MPKGKKTDMQTSRDIIYRLRKQESFRAIARDLKVYRPRIREIHQVALQHQWLNIEKPMPSDEEIFEMLSPTRTARQHRLDAYKALLLDWKQQKKPPAVIQKLLQDKSCNVDVQALRRYLNRTFPNIPKPIMVRSTTAGEDLEVDFGFLMDCLDDHGVLRKAYVLTLRLRHSRKAFRQVVVNQKTATFLQGHIAAFEFFGGVPKRVVLDNTKAAVLQCTRDNDRIRKSYQDMAEHYGFLISPCLPRTPEHKGGVENDMRYVKHNFLLYFKARLKEKNISVPHYQDLADALKQWENNVADQRKIYGVERSPDDLFFSEEKQALRPLPQERWDPNEWSEAIVQRDWRVIFDSNYYSVPYRLIGKTVQLCSTENKVRIFHENHEVACYPRSKGRWEYARKSEFAPPIEEEVLQCNKMGLLVLAEKNGIYTHQLVEQLFSHPSIDKLHSARLLMKLSKKYSSDRLEKACQRAMEYKMFTYAFVKNVLKNSVDLEQDDVGDTKDKIVILKQPRFARDPKNYHQNFDRDISRYGNGMGGHWQGGISDQVLDNEQ